MSKEIVFVATGAAFSVMGAGGFGSAVWELLEHEGIEGCRLYRVGVPDEFVEHGSQASWRKRYGLDPAGVLEAVRRHYPELFRQPSPSSRREGAADRPSAHRQPDTEPVGVR